jgi:hypothetical protein
MTSGRTVTTVVLTLLGGLCIGFALDAVVGVAGLVLVGRPIGVRFLPIVVALVSAGAVLLVLARRRPGR